MHLTKFSDYALRVLMIAAAKGEARLTIEDTAEIFGISHGHLKKVVLKLTRAGYLRGIKGRDGDQTKPPSGFGLTFQEYGFRPDAGG